MEDSEQAYYDDYIEIADKVRSGEYFREARKMFDIDIHDPMSDRYLYILFILVSLVTVFISYEAYTSFFPLRPRVPFIYVTYDIVEDRPMVKTLVDYHGEDANVALRRFLVKHYVKLREDYSAPIFDRNHNAVKSLSTPDVFRAYELFISPLNPESPVSLYHRSMARTINIVSIIPIVDIEKEKNNHEYRVQVVYDAVIERGETKINQTRHKVDVAFIYKDIRLDSETGRIEPYGFVVLSYKEVEL